MAEFDLVIRGGTVVTADAKFRADIGVRGETIAALAPDLGPGTREVDASGHLVLPGGIDAHCHVEQLSSNGLMTADDFRSATISAAFGGNTTIIPFAAQHRGDSLRTVIDTCHANAGPKAVIDYGYHLIITDPTDQAMTEHLPALVAEGITSFKVFMTYDRMIIDDGTFLQVLRQARDLGVLCMVHAENNEMIKWMVDRLLASGCTAPRYHAVSHPRIAEVEATRRAVDLTRLMDSQLLIVHVTTEGSLQAVADAKAAGLRLYGETCPQYLFLTAADLDRPGMEGAKYCCSPPLRDEQDQQAIWRGLANGTFAVCNSDHAPYRFDETGKLSAGPNPHFKQIANGMPGLETRLPLLFSEGVGKGRIDIHRFVELTATNNAKLYGLFPRKGTIQVGADADVTVWDPDKRVTLSQAIMHDNMDYCPYEGWEVTGYPVTVVNRGRVVVADDTLQVAPGSGRFLKRDRFEAPVFADRRVPETVPETAFGADVLA